MAHMTRNEQGQDRADLAKAAVDRGMEQLESAKGQLADGAERVAAAMERTADELDGEGEGAISGFGRSVASLTRQLAGGLRESDVEEFAHELSTLARRNPGVFLAGSVALGFGIARFFKAHTPSSNDWNGQDRRVAGDEWQDASPDYGTTEREFDAEDGLDLSGNTEWQSAEDRRGAEQQSAASSDWTSGTQSARTDRDLNSGAKSIDELEDAAADALSPKSGPEATSGGKP